MNELIIDNCSLPVIKAADFLVAPSDFIHVNRIFCYNDLIYVTSGHIYVTEENTDFDVGPGELLILKAGIHHFGKRTIEAGTSWYYSHFTINTDNSLPLIQNDILAKTLSNDKNLSAFRTKLPQKTDFLKDTPIEGKLQKLVSSFNSDEIRKKWKSGRILFDILSDLAEFEGYYDEKSSLSDEITQYLKTHLDSPFSTSDLEKEFYLSYKRLASIYKKETNTTMQTFHFECKMKEAARLLHASKLSISEISACVGISDPLYFSKCFHKYYGISPREYRKQLVY